MSSQIPQLHKASQLVLNSKQTINMFSSNFRLIGYVLSILITKDNIIWNVTLNTGSIILLYYKHLLTHCVCL